MQSQLTHKQQLFVKEYLITKNATEAAMRTYDCKNRNVARSVGAENLAKPSIKGEIERVMDVTGPTIEQIAHVLCLCLEADNYFYDKKTGVISRYPDYTTRLNAVKEYHKIRGL